MSNEIPKKKGLIALIRESLTKTGGCCCGPGETCGEAPKTADGSAEQAQPRRESSSKEDTTQANRKPR